jgi:hypothetical protein
MGNPRVRKTNTNATFWIQQQSASMYDLQGRQVTHWHAEEFGESLLQERNIFAASKHFTRGPHRNF